MAADWGNGYVAAFRLAGQTSYTRPWTIHEVQRAIASDSEIVIVNKGEGYFFETVPRYKAALSRFVQLISLHDLDKSLNPDIYSPDYDSAVL